MLTTEEIKDAFQTFLRRIAALLSKHRSQLNQDYNVSGISHNQFLQIQKFLVAALAIQLKGCRSECIYTLKRHHVKVENGQHFIILGSEKVDKRGNSNFPIVPQLYQLLKRFQESKYHVSIPVAAGDNCGVEHLTFFTLDTLYKKPLASSNVLQYWKYAWGQALNKPVRSFVSLLVMSLSCIDMCFAFSLITNRISILTHIFAYRCQKFVL